MKILVIEDEQRIAHYLKKGLELKSYVVDTAFDGNEGYDLASSEEYACIILDRMLPKKDGIEICRDLRAANIHTPILMLTAKSQVQDRVDGLEGGADDYLAKPFAFIELLARIKALTRRPKKTVSEKIAIDDLELDTNHYTVSRAKKPIKVSKKEYDLLEFLVRNKGQIFSKDQLTKHVWSYDSNVLGNTAQVYLGYLRKKIDLAFPKSAKLIHTIRGFGYTLDTKK